MYCVRVHHTGSSSYVWAEVSQHPTVVRLNLFYFFRVNNCVLLIFYLLIVLSYTHQPQHLNRWQVKWTVIVSVQCYAGEGLVLAFICTTIPDTDAKYPPSRQMQSPMAVALLAGQCTLTPHKNCSRMAQETCHKGTKFPISQSNQTCVTCQSKY